MQPQLHFAAREAPQNMDASEHSDHSVIPSPDKNLMVEQIFFLSPNHFPMVNCTHHINPYCPHFPPEAPAFCGSWGTGYSTAFAENRRSSRFQTSLRSPKREGWVIDGSESRAINGSLLHSYTYYRCILYIDCICICIKYVLRIFYVISAP